MSSVGAPRPPSPAQGAVPPGAVPQGAVPQFVAPQAAAAPGPTQTAASATPTTGPEAHPVRGKTFCEGVIIH